MNLKPIKTSLKLLALQVALVVVWLFLAALVFGLAVVAQMKAAV